DGWTVRLGIRTGAGASRVLRTHDDGPAARPQLAADISLTPAALAPAAHRLGSRSATLPAASIHDDVRVRSGEHAVEVLEARRPIPRDDDETASRRDRRAPRRARPPPPPLPPPRSCPGHPPPAG